LGVKYISSGLGAILNAVFHCDRNHYFLEAQTGYSGLNNKFWGVLFYDHLSDFLQPDFRFGIFLSLIATISWALVVCIRRKKRLQSLFQSWITNGNIEQLPFHHYWSDWHRCQHHQHSGNIRAIAYLVIIGSVLSFIAFIYMIQKLPPEINSIYAYINPIIAVLLRHYLWEVLTVTIAIEVQ
jgi:drug/metabolite transporter (DMT)-like permease